MSEKPEELEDNNLGPFLTGSKNNGVRHRVPPLPGGLPKNSTKVYEEDASKGL